MRQMIGRREELGRNISQSGKALIWKIFAGFCELSTIHGVRYFAEPRRHRSERIWWLIAFGLSLWLCGSSIQSIWSKWHYTPVTMSLTEKETSVSSIAFPSVIICPQTKTYKLKFDLSSLDIRNISNYTEIE